MFNVNDVQISTLVELEEHGVTLSDLASVGNDAVPSAKILAAVAFLKLRCNDKSATWEDALACRMSEVHQSLSDGDAHPE